MFRFNYFRSALRASKFSKPILAILLVGLVGSAVIAVNTLQGAGAAAQALSCSGPTHIVEDTPGTFTASGGNGTYRWSSAQSTGNARTYTVAFPNPGEKTITVTSGGETATCTVQVMRAGGGGGDNPLAVSCSGSPATIAPGGTVTWTANATGGAGNYTYSWTGNGSFPSGVTGRTVTHQYLGGDGTRNANVTVTSGGVTKTASCSIEVRSGGGTGGTAVSCSGPSTLAVNQEGTWTASGGNGTYQWSSPQRNDTGRTYRVSFPNTGAKTITVTSGGQTDTCTVQVTSGGGGGSGDPLQVSCSGSPSKINPGGTVTFTANATGGAGNYTYSWTGNGSFPSGATGRTVTHQYLGGPGVRNVNVTVTSGGQTKTASCSITVENPDGTMCQALQYSEVSIGGSRATASVTNPNPASSNCAQQVGLISYDTSRYPYAGNSTRETFLDNQVRIDVDGPKNVAPGATVNFSVSIPQCEFQVDFYKGNYVPTAAQLDDGVNGLELKKWKVSSGIATIPGRECPGNPTLACVASPSSALVGDPVSFTASGGNGSYNWTVNGGGSPSTGSGSVFTTRFSTTGTKTATVTSGGQTATCPVTIFRINDQGPVCAPRTQTVGVNQAANLSATGGNGAFSWSVNGGNPATGSGSTFSPRFSKPGTFLVTVTSNGRSDQCTVVVQEEPSNLVCNPSDQTVVVGESADFYASGGSGSYTWTGGGSPSTGSGSHFTTIYSSAGNRTVTVRDSQNRTATCRVEVDEDVDDLRCTPSNQTVQIGEDATFVANGGSGSYTWTGGGSPSTGSGSTFQTEYFSEGNRTVTVRDGQGRTAQCHVNVEDDDDEVPPVCRPSTQDAEIGEEVSFTASGGDGHFTWRAEDGSPRTGSGSRFETSFDDDGTFLVTVTSNGRSDSCVVHVEDEDDDDDLDCRPSRQDAEVDEWVSFTASGGSGSYRWRAENGDPRTGNGRRFETRFDDEGTETVRVTDSRGRTATCRVEVEEDENPRDLSCSPSIQNVFVNEEVTFNARGGTGDYEWDARDGRPRFGNGSRFTTRFNAPGQYDVELESNGERETCRVNVQAAQSSSLFCSPSTQSANVNDFVTFSVTGGNGSYSWSTSFDGSPSSGTGSNFGTRFTTAGTKFVTVTSDGQTSQCIVQIGSVLGASTVVTGPGETAAVALGLGFLGAMGAYGAYFRKSPKEMLDAIVNSVAKRIR